ASSRRSGGAERPSPRSRSTRQDSKRSTAPSPSPNYGGRHRAGGTMTIQTMRRRVLTGAAAIAVTLAAACGGTSGPPAPRDVVLGVDVCEYCHMSVDEPDFAAQWVAADGRKLVFDEPGCLLAWLDDHAGAKGTAFVADAEGTGWLPATEASF